MSDKTFIESTAIRIKREHQPDPWAVVSIDCDAETVALLRQKIQDSPRAFWLDPCSDNCPILLCSPRLTEREGGVEIACSKVIYEEA